MAAGLQFFLHTDWRYAFLPAPVGSSNRGGGDGGGVVQQAEKVCSST